MKEDQYKKRGGETFEDDGNKKAKSGYKSKSSKKAPKVGKRHS
jgi:hypothetical protein